MTSVLLVAGSAPCVLEDLERARGLFPDHEVMTVNGACSVIEQAEHCLAGHTEHAEQYAACRRREFPNAKPWRLHANWHYHPRRRPVAPANEYPSVTDWHGSWASSGATSAGKAARIGLHLGFDRVILCGCPMDGSGYIFDEATVKAAPGMQRVGDPRMQDRTTIRRYRDTMAQLAQTEFKGRVFSMSGFTKQVLGAP